MRTLWIFGSLALLSACSSYSIHCNKHLRPINVPYRSVSSAQPAAVSPVPPTAGSPASPAEGAAVSPAVGAASVKQ
jgi:hypothetical protein